MHILERFDDEPPKLVMEEVCEEDSSMREDSLEDWKVELEKKDIVFMNLVC